MASYLRSYWFGTAATNESTGTNEPSPKLPENSSPPSQPPTISAPISLAESSTLNESTGTNETSSENYSPPARTILAPTSSVEPIVSISISTPDETQEETEVGTDEDMDIPPAFPSLNSVQRASTSRSKALARSDAALMPPPALPTTKISSSYCDSSTSSSLASKPNNVSTLSSALPLPTSNTLKILGASNASSNRLQLPPSTTHPPPALSKKKRGKVALAPGHSPLDWAALKTSGQDLRGVSTLMRVTPSQLKLHNKRDDAWSSFNGKVYNITPYLSFHPGGEKELMRVAGRDGTKLFALTHAWVNVEFMLDECLVGFLVPEPSSAT